MYPAMGGRSPIVSSPSRGTNAGAIPARHSEGSRALGHPWSISVCLPSPGHRRRFGTTRELRFAPRGLAPYETRCAHPGVAVRIRLILSSLIGEIAAELRPKTL